MALEKRKDSEYGKDDRGAGEMTGEGKSAGNRYILIAVAIIVAVVIAGAIFYIASQTTSQSKPLKTGVEESGQESIAQAELPTGEPSFDELLSKAFEAGMRIEKGSADMSATMEMGGDVMAGQEMSMRVGMEAKYDKANNIIYSRASSSITGAQLPFNEQVIESYIVDDVVYTKLADPYGGQDYWIKQPLGYDFWESLESTNLSEILDLVQGQIVGTETKNGREAYKLVVQPNIGKLVEYMYSMGNMGISVVEMDELIGQITNSVKKADFTIWISTNDYLPIAMEGSIEASLDIGELVGTAGQGTLDLSIELLADADYDSPVDIRLPDEALDAVEFAGNTASYCGDGWCDELYGEDAYNCQADCYCGNYICETTEDEESCPEDCST